MSLRCLAGALALLCRSALVCGDDPDWMARSHAGMVAADHPQASRIGAEILKSGGNAFDAAIATSLALTVCRPESTGIGGGGFLIAYIAAEQRFIALDFRETAPAAATPERYARLHAEKGAGPSPSIYGGNAVAVPGLVAGLVEIQRRFSSRPWKELVLPAAALARQGFDVDKTYRDACVEALRDVEKYPGFRERFAGLMKQIAPDGRVREIGARFERPEMAVTLRLLAERGAAAFYDEPIGPAIVRAANDAGGALTLDDLKSYRVKERTPLRFSTPSFANDGSSFEWITMPPPSSGGVTLAQICQASKMLESGCGGGLYAGIIGIERRIESYKHAFANRARYLGDPDFISMPIERLISLDYAQEIADRARDWESRRADEEYGMVLRSASQPGAMPPDDRGTSHFCIADRFGNVVSMTETINGGYGSFVIVEPFGIILNNQIDDFTTVLGEANLFGLVQGTANLVAPGKRPLSSMSPTIIARNGKPVLAIGASGGPRIITAVQCVASIAISGYAVGVDLLEGAMREIRLHHQWKPDEAYFDREPEENMAEVLKYVRFYGHAISDTRRRASVQVIQLQPNGEMIGACDPNKGGQPAVP